MKKMISLLTLILLLVIFPLLNSGALADFMGTGPLSMNSLVEPVNMLLFGIGLTFVGTRA